MSMARPLLRIQVYLLISKLKWPKLPHLIVHACTLLTVLFECHPWLPSNSRCIHRVGQSFTASQNGNALQFNSLPYSSTEETNVCVCTIKVVSIFDTQYELSSELYIVLSNPCKIFNDSILLTS